MNTFKVKKISTDQNNTVKDIVSTIEDLETLWGKLEKEKSNHIKNLAQKGYSIKNEDDIDYIYTCDYHDEQQKWIRLGKADEYFKNATEQKARQAKFILEQIKTIEDEQEKIRAKIRNLKKQAEEILLDCLIG